MKTLLRFALPLLAVLGLLAWVDALVAEAEATLHQIRDNLDGLSGVALLELTAEHGEDLSSVEPLARIWGDSRPRRVPGREPGRDRRVPSLARAPGGTRSA